MNTRGKAAHRSCPVTFGKMETKTVNIEGIEIISRVRRGLQPAVVCIHGLGDTESSFEPLFKEESLKDLTIATVDMPGCGRSTRPHDFSYSMKDQAELVLHWVRELDSERIILAGHSMGGVIGLYAAESLPPERASGFISVEGNLGPEDCFFSGRIASYSEEEFVDKGFYTVARMLRLGAAGEPQTVMEKYVLNFSRALPLALHRSSVSLVEESRDGRLKERFLDLPMAKGFISGERSLCPSTAEYLAENEILHFKVLDSGHFMMLERPEAFCEAFRQTLEAMEVLD